MFEHTDHESGMTLEQALSMVPEQRKHGRDRTADHVFSLQLPKTKFSFTSLRRSGLIPFSKKRSSLPSVKSKWRPFRPIRPPRELCPPVPIQMSISQDVLLSKLGPEGNLPLAEVMQQLGRGTRPGNERDRTISEQDQELAHRHREKAYRMLTSDEISGMSSVDDRAEFDYPPSRIATLSPRQQALSSSFSTLPDTASKLDLRPPPLRMALSQRPAYIPPPFPSRATSPPPIPPRSRLRPPNGMTDASSPRSSQTSPASARNSISVYAEHDSELLPVDLTPPSSPLSVESASSARDNEVSYRPHPYSHTEDEDNPFLSSPIEGKTAAKSLLLEKTYSPQTQGQFCNMNLSKTQQEMTKAQQRPGSAKHKLRESDVKDGMEGLNRWIDETTAMMRDASRSSSSTSHQVSSPTFERDTVSSSRTLVPSSNRLDHVRVVSQVEEHQKPYAKPEVDNMTALEGGLSPSESRPVTRLTERSSAVSSTTSLSSYEAMPTDLQRVEMIINGRVYPTLVASDGRLWEIPWCVTNNT